MNNHAFLEIKSFELENFLRKEELHMIDLRDEVKQANEAFALDWYKDDTRYTDIGSAVHDIKYKYILSDSLTNEQMEDDLEFLAEKLLPFTDDIDLILPVPSFNPKYENNPKGDLKIMYMLADRLSSKEKKVDCSVLKKMSSSQAKDSQLNESDYIAEQLSPEVSKVLLIDDLFGEGNTAKYTILALKEKNPNIFVRFISLTKNQYGGIPKCYICKIPTSKKCYDERNGCMGIMLNFHKDSKLEQVYIWQTHSKFPEVKQAYDNNDFNKGFKFFIYKNKKGYWAISNK